MANSNPNQHGVSEQEIKQNSGVSATMALQAMQKAWELRQAANAAGDPNAREEILAKAINKEIEAESFGKAAKYTRSGTFQGLAAGAGLGVQPGVTLGKLTGALVGGVVSTVTGLLGGGIGSVYGAINGPFWDLGEMASHGVRSIVGDFPNWKSTPAQKKALEKMIMQTRETQAPTKEELEEMKADAPDGMPQSWSQSAKDVTSWRPSMPNMPSMPSMPQGAAVGLGGLGASIPSWGGQDKSKNPKQGSSQEPRRDNQQTSQNRNQQPKPSSRQQPKQRVHTPQEAPTPREGLNPEKAHSQEAPVSKTGLRPQATSKSKVSSHKPEATLPKETSKIQTGNKPLTTGQAKRTSISDNKDNKLPAAASTERKKPRKLATRCSNAQPSQAPTPRKTPRKLETRKPAA